MPVTSDEYYLIENRLDDLGDDLTVAIEQERGVVLGPVDPDCTDPICPVNHEYDFLLPGPGMLIYHIDDTRVQPGLMPYDTVNADRHRLGVAVEEADGIMDLGNILSFYWSGSRYDPFFAENNASFSWDTYPATDTNMGGKTYLRIDNISDPGEVMTMDVSFDRWKDGWPTDLAKPLGSMTPRVADIDGDGDGEVIVASRDGEVYAWHHDGTPVIPMCGVLGRFAVVPGGITRSPSAADIDGDGDAEVVVASAAGSLYVWDHTDDDADGYADLHSTGFPVALDGPASSTPVVSDFGEAEGLEIAVASAGRRPDRRGRRGSAPGFLALFVRTPGPRGRMPRGRGPGRRRDVGDRHDDYQPRMGRGSQRRREFRRRVAGRRSTRGSERPRR